MSDMKKLLETIDSMSKAEKKPTGPKFPGYWKGTDPASKAKDKMVGSAEESIIKDLHKTAKEKVTEWRLEEEYKNFSEADYRTLPIPPVPDAPKAGSWQELWKNNLNTVGANPHLIKPGQELTLPGGGKYTVQKGDTLSGIAKKMRSDAAPQQPAPQAQKPQAAAPSAPPKPIDLTPGSPDMAPQKSPVTGVNPQLQPDPEPVKPQAPVQQPAPAPVATKPQPVQQPANPDEPRKVTRADPDYKYTQQAADEKMNAAKQNIIKNVKDLFTSKPQAPAQNKPLNPAGNPQNWVSGDNPMDPSTKPNLTNPYQTKESVEEQFARLMQEQEEADYGDKYQAMVQRVGQKAREQEKRKPTDINALARKLWAADKQLRQVKQAQAKKIAEQQPNATDPNAQATNPTQQSTSVGSTGIDPAAQQAMKDQQVDVATAKGTVSGLKSLLGPQVDTNAAASGIAKANDGKPLNKQEQQGVAGLTPLMMKAAETPAVAQQLKTALSTAGMLSKLGK